jgi:hypothetical protein
MAADVGLHEQDDLWAALEAYQKGRHEALRSAVETSPKQGDDGT